MFLSDISVKRPVLAAVMSMLIVLAGVVAFLQLSIREYPDTDPPIVSVETVYRGAAANVIESRITQVTEDRISGIRSEARRVGTACLIPRRSQWCPYHQQKKIHRTNNYR